MPVDLRVMRFRSSRSDLGASGGVTVLCRATGSLRLAVVEVHPPRNHPFGLVVVPVLSRRLFPVLSRGALHPSLGRSSAGRQPERRTRDEPVQVPRPTAGRGAAAASVLALPRPVPPRPAGKGGEDMTITFIAVTVDRIPCDPKTSDEA